MPRHKVRRYHRSRSTDRRGPQDGVADLSHTCGSDRIATCPVRACRIQFHMFCYYNRVGSAIPKSDAVVYSLSLRLRRGRWEEFAVQSSTRLLFNCVCFWWILTIIILESNHMRFTCWLTSCHICWLLCSWPRTQQLGNILRWSSTMHWSLDEGNTVANWRECYQPRSTAAFDEIESCK